MEDKQRILDLWLPALRATRNLADLVRLQYDRDDKVVLATFENGYTKVANVNMDSGTAMMFDVLKQIL